MWTQQFVRLIAALSLGSSVPATAAVLVDQTFAPDGYFVGAGGDLQNLGAYLGSEAGGYFVGRVGNPADVAAATALFVTVRSFDIGSYGEPVGEDQQFTADEIANINAFLATGRRVIIVGENQSFTNWDTSVLSLAGDGHYGMLSGSSGTASAIVANDLTLGAETLNIVEGGSHTSGGTELYDQNFATLWRPDANLLTVLDVNVFDDQLGNSRFEQNVAAWLGASTSAVPEPSSWIMLVCGFGAIGTVIRRRRLLASGA